MEVMGAMPDGKLYAKSFLQRWMAVVLCRMGNYMRKVSCRNGKHGCYAVWETECESFPAAMEGSGAISDGKLFNIMILPKQGKEIYHGIRSCAFSEVLGAPVHGRAGV